MNVVVLIFGKLSNFSLTKKSFRLTVQIVSLFHIFLITRGRPRSSSIIHNFPQLNTDWFNSFYNMIKIKSFKTLNNSIELISIFFESGWKFFVLSLIADIFNSIFDFLCISIPYCILNSYLFFNTNTNDN